MRVPAPLHPVADVLEIDVRGSSPGTGGRRAHLLAPLGRGSSSTVFRALLESSSGVERLVAIRLFGTISTEDADGTADRIATAARRNAAVRHPNIVELHDFGWRRTQPYFVSELVEGVSLATLLARYASTSRRLPLDVALFIASETAEALAGARIARDHHGRQLDLLHLALGPRKVLLGFSGQVKVVGFETSLATSASSSVRSLASVAHRTATMAPEVAMGESGDARSDVFSLGVLMREIFVAPRFAKAVSNHDAVRLAREGFIESVSFGPNLPEALATVIDRALALDPEERYPNANALASDLRRVALAMGVGDGRMFLRRVIEREWGNDTEVTMELLDPPSAPDTLRPVACEDLEGLPTIATLLEDVPSSSDGAS